MISYLIIIEGDGSTNYSAYCPDLPGVAATGDSDISLAQTQRLRCPMATTAAVEVPFATASPEKIREVLLPEELPRFEEQYREAHQVAAETFRLDKLEACLRSWRRIAWMTASDPQAHRRMLDKAQRILTGERFPSVSAEEMRARLRERLGR